MQVIGLAGTAKNTGKTTATAMIMARAHRQGHQLAVTSIGYDGEAIDNVTALPKPRLTFLPGMIVATAERCMKALGGRVEVLGSTGFATPLGEVKIGKILNETLVVLAGPNNTRDLQCLLQTLKQLTLDMVIIDGALNRMAPMAVTDGLIICTGAACRPEIEKLVRETQILTRLFQLPNCPRGLAALLSARTNQVLVGDSVIEGRLLGSSVLVQDDADELWSRWQKVRWAYVPGVISSRCLRRLIEIGEHSLANKLLVVEDGVKLAVGHDPQELNALLEDMKRSGCTVTVRRELPIIAVTVNPFYPAYCLQTHGYQEAYVDREQLLQGMQDHLQVPVFNVMLDQGEGLFTLLTAEHPV